MESQRKIQVLVQVEDVVIRSGLVAILSQEADITVQDHEQQHQVKFDVIVASYQLGVELAANKNIDAGVLIVTEQDREREICAALSNGVMGYLLLSCDTSELIAGVHAVSEGLRYLSEPVGSCVADSLTHSHLTERETDVLHLLAEGCCNKSIARRLGIAPGTVKTHVKVVIEKLGATARTHAVIVATRRGLVDCTKRHIERYGAT